MFTNPDVFTMVHRLVVGRRWQIWKAPVGSQFVRSDHPVATSTNGTMTVVMQSSGLSSLSPRLAVAGGIVLLGMALVRDAGN